jgi:hypothetical protein
MAAPPTTNGSGSNGAAVAGDSDEEGVMRPVNIEQDVREMERRKRVEAIMGSKLFREELEKVVSDTMRADGSTGADGISSMVSDLMAIKGGIGGSARGTVNKKWWFV